MDLLKKKSFLNSIIILFILLSGCSKSTDMATNNSENEENNEEETEETFNYTSEAAYNLNIVYFIPKGGSKRKDAHRRLSEILIQGQDFYKQHMMRYGFGEKTFHMLKDAEKNRVKIIFIDGKYSASNYPYEGGGGKMIEEIEAYFSTHPTEKTSEHVLVLSPVSDPTNSDAPYYGLGKWCFATDYDDMDIKHLGGSSTLSTRATTYIGGLLHELGHGLNLPHNKEKVSDISNTNKGTALMGAGNYTYGNTPTFLTEASCAILNNNQIFNTNNDHFYTGASARIETIQATYINGNLNITGAINSDIPVNYVGFYNDPADDNADYDAVTWATPTHGNDFSISMPINELHKKGDTEYVLRLRLNHTSGDITNVSYAYKFKNDIPIIEFGDQDYLDRSNWTINSYSSQEDGGGENNTGFATHLLDDNPETYWHSCWSNCSTNYPHHIIIDTGETISAKGFSFLQRSNLSRAIKDIEILVSTDNQNWNSLGSFALKEINSIHHINLDNTTSFRYFKIVANSAFDGQQFASLAEIKCF